MKPERSRVLAEGLVAGLLGYVTIVVYFGLVNLASGRSFFHTAAELGSGMVGADAIGGVEVGSVLAFNGIHLLAFLAIGLVAAWIIGETEKHPSLFVLLLFTAISVFLLAVAGFGMLEASIGRGPPLFSVAIADLLAAIVMSVYLFRAHPRLWGEIRDHADPETEHPTPG
jgi:hypothetical protein